MASNIIFMGTSDFAVPILKSISESNHKIKAVYTQPPKKKSRGQKIEKSPINLESIKLNISVRHPNNLNSDDEYNFIKKSGVKFIIVVAYGQIIPQKILDIPNEMVWLMPEGLTPEQLSDRRTWLMELCEQEGYNFTDRLHIIAYGDKRGV